MTFVDSPLFGFFLSIIAFQIGLYINKKTGKAIFNPLIISMVIIIGLLGSLNIEFESYNKGGSIITFFIGPATVLLAVPLYRQIERFKESAVPILVGISVGTIIGISSIIVLGKLLGLSDLIIRSLVPKSTTTAISQEISIQIGGISGLSVAATVITGIIGNIIGTYVFKIFNIKNEEAEGVALGGACHAVGTAKAVELGEVQGAMASISIGISGIVTVFIAPLLIKILL